MQVTQIGEWKLTEDELDDIECGTMTVDEARVLRVTDLIDNKTSTALAKAQGTIFSGDHDRSFILIKIE